MGFQLSLGARVRQSPFFEKTVADGVTAFTVYNHMLMPTGYGDPEAEYWRLIEGVAMWDVAVERQVEIAGRGAAELVRLLTPRNLDRLTPGRGRYVPLCDHNGRIINDPVLLPLAEDRFWLSLADSDILLWTRAVAAERGLDVKVLEPDVSPLAIQGPNAGAVARELFGSWTDEIAFFAFREVDLDGIPLVVARSGWSKQGGFELYLRDGTKGGALWDKVKEAGAPHGIGPGNPNPVERIESGLISYGADTDDATDPFELGLGNYVDCDQSVDFIGKAALRAIRDAGPARRLAGFVFAEPLSANAARKWPLWRDGSEVGFVSATAYSPRLRQYIGIGLVAAEIPDGAPLVTENDEGRHALQPVPLPFTGPYSGRGE